MAQISILYDGTFEGFLSSVFEIYRQHLDVSGFIPEGRESAEADLFSTPMQIETSAESVARIQRAIENAASRNVLDLLRTAFLSEEPGLEMQVLAYLRKLFSGLDPHYGKNPASLEMLPIFKLAQAVRHEQGGLLGLVRFTKVEDDFYVSEIEPKYDVVTLLESHFRQRQPNMRWVIYDSKRKYGIYYDKVRTQIVQVPDTSQFSKYQSQDQFISLWQSYYNTMAIKERLNPKLLKRCLPVRYWSHLPERAVGREALSW